MDNQPPDPDIAHLLAELQSSDFVSRLAAVNALAAAKVETEEVINALKAAAETDASAYVRAAALRVLTALGVAVGDLKAYVAPPGVDTWLTRNEKIVAFVIGFVGWNLVSFLLVVIGDGLAGLLLLANPIALFGLAFTRRWVALGMLSALALNVLIFTLGTGWKIAFVCYGWDCMVFSIFPIWAWFIPFY